MQWHRIPRKRKPSHGKFIRKTNHDQGVQTRVLTEEEWQTHKKRS